MHASPFESSEPALLEVVESSTSEEYNSEYSLHLCQDERSLSPSIEFEPPNGLESIVLDLDRDTTIDGH